MSRLDDLVHDVENMDIDELLKLVRSIRGDRKVSKRAIKTKTKATREKAGSQLKAILASMNPDDVKAMLEGRKGK